MDWPDVRKIHYVAFRQRHPNRIGYLSGEQLHPQSFKFVTHKESIVLCLHRLFDDHFLERNTIKEELLCQFASVAAETTYNSKPRSGQR